MFKKLFAPWLYSRELEAVISDINSARRELSVALELARTNEAFWACDAKILRDEAVKKNATIAKLEARLRDTGAWIHQRMYAAADEIMAAGTADANGVPLADEEPCQIIAFPGATRTIQ